MSEKGKLCPNCNNYYMTRTTKFIFNDPNLGVEYDYWTCRWRCGYREDAK